LEPEENEDNAGETPPPEGASSSAVGQPVDYTDAPPQWGTLGLDSENDQQLGPGPVGPMPAGWPLQPIGLGVPALGPISPLELTSATRQDDPSTEPLPAPELKSEPPPEVAPVELTQHEAQPQLSSLELQSPAAPEVAPLSISSAEQMQPLEVPREAMPEGLQELVASEHNPPEALPEIQTGQNSPVEALPELSGGRSEPPSDLGPLEVSVPRIEDLEPLRVTSQELESLPGVALPDPPQLQDLPPLQLSTQQLDALPPLDLPQHGFQEIDVESMLASVQQREEKSFFQLTGNVPLLSEM